MDGSTYSDPEIPETEPEGTVTDEGQVDLPEVDPAEQGVDPEFAELGDDARRARWQSRRPRILHLKEAVTRIPGEGGEPDELLPLFDVGDRIVVDRCTSLLRGDPWLETIVGRVRSIDDETGLVTMFDEAGDPRMMLVRYTNFKDVLHDFRLAPARGNPFTVSAVRQAAKPEPKPGDPPKRGRGRPKGSKNRAKDAIEAERAAYRKLKEERKKGKR